ncbi:right-handed parallel beta-helix repeat-containing protein [Candidatus Pelagibacter sp.]|nr:right-handed parallel beta-helix repeat-containing protein [Candidatus Pelagibacter sp.]
MKIKFLLRKSIIIFSPFFLIILLLLSFNVFKKDYSFGHKSIFFYPTSFDWLNYYKKLYFQKFKNNFYSKKVGLDQIHIFISEKNNNKLLNDLPSSTDRYVNAEIKGKKNKIEKVKLKYKGANPYNWLFDQKEIRIKYSKKKTINNRRYYDYRISQTPVLSDYLYFKLANKIIKPAYDVKLVELFINNKSKGIHIERGVLREDFLRRNKLMPVNIYRGEQLRYEDKNLGLEAKLFDNVGLWKKTSYLNYIDKDDYSDLNLFLDKINKSSTSSNALKSLLDYENLDILSTFGAFQIISQAPTKDNYHNQRFILDPWSGSNYIFVHDGSYISSNDNIALDFVADDMMEVLTTSSEYLLSKYIKTYELLNDDNVIENMINEINLVKEKYLISFKRDTGKIQRKYRFPGDEKETLDLPNELITSLKLRKKKLNNIFNANPNASWENTKKGFMIKVNDHMPVSNIKPLFKYTKPKYIVLDVNYNNIIDDSDFYFYPNENDELIINLNLFSNRIITYHSEIKPNKSNKTKSLNNTKFNFILESQHKFDKIYAQNFFSKNNYEINKEINISYKAKKFNNPIKTNENNNKIILEGNLDIHKNKIYNDAVIIKEGTVFNLCNKCSLMFKNKVIAEGKKKKPIIFQGINGKNWGAIGIVGEKTENSKLSNLIIKNGSGAQVDNIYLYASLSLNNTKNIKISNLTMKKNFLYDDMMHIVYSRNVEINNSEFYDSFLDTIDVDISENINFNNIQIVNSGNDGIDFMESKSKLQNIYITNSKDKGLSVGENSNIELNNSKITRNNYGIVSKDDSIAILKNTQITNNIIQLAVYKKNWRYGKSGNIELHNIKLNEGNNTFQSDKDGSIIFKTKDIKQKITYQKLK